MTGERAPGAPSPPANPSHSFARRLMAPADFVCLNEVPFRPPRSIPVPHSVAQSAMTIRRIFRPFDDDVHVDVS